MYEYCSGGGVGEIVARGVFWVWCDFHHDPCYVNRCAETGVLIGGSYTPPAASENTPRAIDGLEFA